MFKKLSYSLAFRLFALIVAVMTISFSFYAYQTIKAHTNNLMAAVYLSSDRASDIIKRSTRYAMMLNRKEDVHHIIRTVGNEPGMEEIRIYNKKGEIIFSTIPSEQHMIVDMQAEACHICHSDRKPLESVSVQNRRRIYRGKNGHRILGVINPINNEPECYNAACHAHASDQKILGVLDVKMSLSPIDEQLRKSRKDMVTYATLMVLSVALFSGLFIYIGVRRRVKKLIVGTQQIASGNLQYRLEMRNNDEIGHLAFAFNKMTMDLQKAYQQIKEWSDSLEEKVYQKSKELEKAHEHIIRIEKLASLGKLSATVAHEINNPLAGILNYTVLVLRILKEKKLNENRLRSVIDYLTFTKAEITRCGEIVQNMLIFAKQTGSDFTEEHLEKLIDSSLMLIKHQLDLNEIKIEKSSVCSNDVILCDAGQIRQALVALYVNAIESMNKGGMLSVKTTSSDEHLCVNISDQGCGIAPEHLDKIFDPFFSTKNATKGVGLGLAVVYGIVQRHNGNITVESHVNEGTTFRIELPRKPILNSDE